MRSRFAILLAIAAVCVTAAWAGWASEEQLTTNRYFNYLHPQTGHKMVVAQNGVRHLVWYTANSAVYYKRWYPGSGWTRDTLLTTIKNSFYPAIALDSNGTDIHVIWSGDGGTGKKTSSHVYYMKCVPSSSGTGGWAGPPTDLTPDAAGRSYYASSVASFRDQAQVVHVEATWFEYYPDIDSIGFRECVGGSWGNTTYFTMDIPGHTTTLWYPSVAADPQGRYGDVFLLYWVADPDTLLVLRRQGGVWQSLDCPSSGLGGLAVEVDPATGYPHVIGGTSSRYINHTYWDPVDGWRPIELVSDPSVIVAKRPNMFFGGGSAFVVWAESTSASGRGVRYRIGNYGNWTMPAWVTSGYFGERPNVTVSANGNAYVVWEKPVSSRYNQLWGRFYTPGGGDGGGAEPVALSQTRVEMVPNPAKAGHVTIRYSLPSAEPMTVTLLDVSGRVVKSLEMAADRNGSVGIDVRGLNAGVYVARLVAGDLTVSKSLVVQR